MKKRISALVLVLVLVLSMSANVMATEIGTDAELVLTNAENADGQTVVSLWIQGGDGVTNGRVSVKYDSELVKLVDVGANSDCGFTSVNDQTVGEVTLAWAGSDFGADKTALMELTFDLCEDAAGTAVYTAKILEAYADGTAVKVKEATLKQKIEFAEEPTTPSEEPTTPSEEPTTPSEEPTTPPTEPVECPFTDIEGHWAQEKIEKVYANDLFKGMTETLFVPEGVMNRGMFVTVLYRMEGKPEVTGKYEFTDVPEDEYYADAVAWAVSVGVTYGVSDTRFAPTKALTRQEMVTMLYRYAKMKGDDVSGRADLTKFTDYAKVENWAKDSIAWAVKEGLVYGYPDNTLRPSVSTTRAQVAAILCRYLGL